MKTIDEIKERVLGAGASDQLMSQLSSGHPLSIFVPEFIKEEFQNDVLEITPENVIAQMKEYIDFAFGKAYGCRGISSGRSIWKFGEWLWLLEDELYDFSQNDDNYPMYGVPILRKIAEKFEFTDPHPDYKYRGDEVWA